MVPVSPNGGSKKQILRTMILAHQRAQKSGPGSVPHPLAFQCLSVGGDEDVHHGFLDVSFLFRRYAKRPAGFQGYDCSLDQTCHSGGSSDQELSDSSLCSGQLAPPGRYTLGHPPYIFARWQPSVPVTPLPRGYKLHTYASAVASLGGRILQAAVELEKFGLLANGVSASANCKSSSVMGSVDDIYSDLPNSKVFPSSLDITYENDSLEAAACAPSVAPVTNNVNDLDCDVIGDELDSFLDFELASQKVPQLIPVFPTGNSLLSSLGTTGLPAPSPLPPASFGLLDPRKPPVLPLKPSFAPSLEALDSFETMRETLDSLDTFVNDTKRAEPILVKTTQKQKPVVNSVNHLFAHKTDPGLSKNAAPPLLPNPLAQTYDFKQGCQLCYVRTVDSALGHAHTTTPPTESWGRNSDFTMPN
ncbi:unnamed protein product [Ranitomeya imitator]|uniref:Uncharacterized protein n=1 Tax=Ranitomeya imitator TaxID=111125 RepID=A0ABN9L2E5_9NEOB|nr:unnamed protein product [Ranitomeya imitator]